MRRAAVACAAVLAAGAVAVAIAGIAERRDLAFTLGVGQVFPTAPLTAGDELCQRPIAVSAPFDVIRFRVGTFGREGSAFRIEVRDLRDRRLASERVPAGYADNTEHSVRVREVPEGRLIAVCAVNAGPDDIAIYGGPVLSARTSSAELNGRLLLQDVSFVFLRDEEESLLALVPDMVERASIFRGSWIRPWVIWILFGGALVAVPLLLVLAVRSAARDMPTSAK